MKKIGILMGSASDLPVAKKALAVLEEYGVPHELLVCSAHRSPDKAADYAKSARQNGCAALICIAGLAAHLAGAVAAHTTLPVIGVPVASGGLGGMDALLSTVQMPTGVPVATVAVGGGANAALLCLQMLAITDSELAKRLDAARQQLAQQVEAANQQLQQDLFQ